MVPGGVQEMTGDGTQCSGLVNMVLLLQFLFFFSYMKIRDINGISMEFTTGYSCFSFILRTWVNWLS